MFKTNFQTESKDYVPAAVPMAPVEAGLRFMTVEAPDNYTTPSWSAVGRRGVPMAPVEAGLRFMTVEAPDNYTTPSWSAVGRRRRRSGRCGPFFLRKHVRHPTSRGEREERKTGTRPSGKNSHPPQGVVRVRGAHLHAMASPLPGA